MQYPTKWLPVAKSLASSRWLSWKTALSTDKTGTTRFYGVDAGPSAVCFDSKLLSQAGLPSTPATFAKWIGTSWDSYFAAGEQYTAKTGKPWFDSSTWILESKIRQIQYSFEDKNNKIIATTNPAVKAAYESSLQDYSKLSAKLAPFSTDWNSGYVNEAWATELCPSWMLGVIQAAAPKVTTWNVADTFPGGGTNAGGSFLAVSTQTPHPTEAKAFAAWLTAPAQQIVAFQAAGAFPSQVAALKSSVLLNSKSTYASGAPTGQIYAHQAETITGAPYAGPNYNTIFNDLQAATTRVETGQMSETASWNAFVTAVKSINTK
jgi:cellobiose transport system substrate-binding protein